MLGRFMKRSRAIESINKRDESRDDRPRAQEAASWLDQWRIPAWKREEALRSSREGEHMRRLRCLLVVEALDGACLGADHGHLGDVVGGAAAEEGPREGRPLLLVLRDEVLPRRSRGRHAQEGGQRMIGRPGVFSRGGKTLVLRGKKN